MNWYSPLKLLFAQYTDPHVRGYWIAPSGKVYNVQVGYGHGSYFSTMMYDKGEDPKPAHSGFGDFADAGYIRVINEAPGLSREDRFSRAVDLVIKPTPQQLDVLFKIFPPKGFTPVYFTFDRKYDELANTFEEFYNLLTSKRWPPVDVSKGQILDQPMDGEDDKIDYDYHDPIEEPVEESEMVNTASWYGTIKSCNKKKKPRLEDGKGNWGVLDTQLLCCGYPENRREDEYKQKLEPHYPGGINEEVP